MSNETKRDVFEYYLDLIKAIKDPLAPECVRVARKRYAAALPDDLPVIPKSVGEYIKGCQTVGGVHNLIDAFAFTQGGIAEKWIYEHSDTFALAWLLGDWEVEDEPA
jgi:hypothetical protein